LAVSLVSAWRAAAADALPLQQAVEIYLNEKGDVIVIRLRLEQPFLAEELVKSKLK
jgi:hypothetical protein